MNNNERRYVMDCMDYTQNLRGIFNKDYVLTNEIDTTLREKLQQLGVTCSITYEDTINFCSKGEDLHFTLRMNTAKIRQVVQKDPTWLGLAQLRLREYTKSTIGTLLTTIGGAYLQYRPLPYRDFAYHELLAPLVENIPGYSALQWSDDGRGTVDDYAAERAVYYATTNNSDRQSMWIFLSMILMVSLIITTYIRVYSTKEVDIENPVELLFRQFLSKRLGLDDDQINITFQQTKRMGFYFGNAEMTVTIRPKFSAKKWSEIFDYPSNGEQSNEKVFKEKFEKMGKHQVAVGTIKKAITSIQTKIDSAERRAARLKQEAIKDKAKNKRAAITKMKQQKVVVNYIEKLSTTLMALEQKRSQLDQSLVNETVLKSLQRTLAALKEKQIKPEEVEEMLKSIENEADKVEEVAETIGSPSEDFDDVETELQQLENEIELTKAMPIVPTTPIEMKKKNQSLEAGWYMRQWKTRLEAGGSMEERRSFNRVLQQYK